jgi:hypothetical protein
MPKRLAKVLPSSFALFASVSIAMTAALIRSYQGRRIKLNKGNEYCFGFICFGGPETESGTPKN